MQQLSSPHRTFAQRTFIGLLGAAAALFIATAFNPAEAVTVSLGGLGLLGWRRRNAAG